MSNQAWCILNSRGDVLNLHDTHDMCSNPEYKCHKQVTFTPGQYMPEGKGFLKKLQKIFEVEQHGFRFPNPL